jgi:cation diffusion facilitator family transporter
VIAEARPRLTRYAWLSVGAAVITLGFKLVAWALTGSVGLLSDALESLVNLGAALMALWMLHIAVRPADEDHAYGHSKAEYFASGFEGTLVVLAAAGIAAAALPRLLDPRPLAQTGLGLTVSGIASVVNLLVARVLMRAGRKYRSIALTADAHHLMTDVWTSVGVIVGVGLIGVTGWQILDPLVALAMAVNVLVIGRRLLTESVKGLMDAAWPAEEQAVLQQALDEFRARGVQFHAVRTRRSATRRFASFHVLVPGAWTVQQGHDLLEEIERSLADRLASLTVFTHLEPIEDPTSYLDQELDRGRP